MPLLTAALWYCRQLYASLIHLLKWWTRYLRRKFTKSRSVWAEVDLPGYCAQKWKGETEQARRMREVYEDLFWRHHVKYVRQVSRDNYCVLRAVLFQIFSQGIPLPPWMKTVDILKLPEKLLFSQGCNWIQQYSFGPEQYTGSSTLGKLRKCLETLRNQWMEISSIKDPCKRGNLCSALFGDEAVEHQMYEAVKFIMLHQVVEVYECLSDKECLPGFFHLLFRRDTSPDPLSYMMNHLNSVGGKRGLDQVDLFLLGYSLGVNIVVYRLSKFNSKDFRVNCTEASQRAWREVALLTEDDQHYLIPVSQI
ncbi:inactive ubiquitin thioesterase OTULINL [Paroedura picta]|uniref:inactive ubiquitin thioesterase OTULINL n=1 Tax=Paroedura picta TaxID=143630 RepID=UPI004056EEDB